MTNEELVACNKMLAVLRAMEDINKTVDDDNDGSYEAGKLLVDLLNIVTPLALCPIMLTVVSAYTHVGQVLEQPGMSWEEHDLYEHVLDLTYAREHGLFTQMHD